MSDGGYLYWDNARFLKDRPHLDGLEFSTPNETLPEDIQWEPEEPEAVYKIPTKAKTHRIQQVALGSTSPLVRRSYKFSATFKANKEEEYFSVLRSAERGAVVNWVPFVWVEEIFNVSATGDFTLSRPVAWGIAASANSTNHAARFFVSNVENPSAGSISGQTFTAATTGVIAVRYLPAFRVLIDGVSNRVPTNNGLEFSVSMREGISLA